MSHAERHTPLCEVALESNESLPSRNAQHIVQFYDDASRLLDVVTDFIAGGLRAGQPILSIATEPHHDTVIRRLTALGFDLDAATERGRLRLLDAREALSWFMVDGWPDPVRFRTNMSDLILGLVADNGQTVRVFGEAVDVLYHDGNGAAAVRLEELWNELVQTLPVQVLCGYAFENFRRDADTQPFLEICAHHDQVVPAAFAGHTADARTREISYLQQRAHALETEVVQRRQLEHALHEARTMQHQTEVALQRARSEAQRANTANSEFLAIMSHELHTPLNGIIGYQDLLDQEIAGPVTTRQREYLGRIKASAVQLHGLVEQVLSLSRLEAGQEETRIESVDAGTIAREVAAQMQAKAARKALKLEVSVPETTVELATDPDKLRQILFNLLDNALQFTNEGSVTLQVRAQAQTVLFHVRDTGSGIKSDELPHLFEPFGLPGHSRPGGGIGLGLPVSRRLARLLGADLTVESQVGSGSTFTLTVTRYA
jgi:signal transduction histidine kinase